MTLILTYLNRHGIIHASDSNLTDRANTAAGEGKKTFPISHLRAGLTVAGSYSVAGESMDTWMDRFIQTDAAMSGTSLPNFAHNLGHALQTQMLPDEKRSGSMVHIAGYVLRNHQYHPEFWFVRNVTGIDPHTGEYTATASTFTITEDFWGRDCPQYCLMEAFQRGEGRIYVNGFASGRITFVFLTNALTQLFAHIWANPEWRFRPPDSLADTDLLVRLYIEVISTLFTLSDYPAPFIGGPTQTYQIPQPPNTVTASPPRNPSVS